VRYPHLCRWLLLSTLVLGFAFLISHEGQTQNAGPTPPGGATTAARPASNRYAPSAQEMRQNYERAAQVFGRSKGRVFKTTVTPHWFDNNTRFWYRNDLRGGAKEFILVDADKGTRQPAFDHKQLAESLSKATNATYEADKLPFQSIEFAEAGKAMRFQAAGAVWQCDLASYECRQVKQPPPAKSAEAAPPEDEAPAVEEDEDAPQAQQKKGQKKGQKAFPKLSPSRDVRSPDQQWTAVVKDHNVVLRHKDGNEVRLTDNGVEGNAYGSFTWSPDSKTLVAYRTEPGDDKLVYTLETAPRDQLRAKVNQRVYPLPGDKFAAREMWLFNVEVQQPVKVEVERIDFQGVPRLRWAKDGSRFTFERTDRGHQRFRVIEVEARTGKTRNLIDEKTDTFHWTNHPPRAGLLGVHVIYLDRSAELLYVTQRDGWKHVYLIDARDGKVKNQVTKGPWVVRGIDRVDEDKRQLWFRASGRDPEQDPYLIHYCRVNFDGTGLVALTDGNGNHTISYSPDGKYLIDTYSRVDMAPVIELRRVADGKLVCPLEKADVSALQETGWRYPEVFHARGRDGTTDIWGIVIRPQKLDEAKKYPIIEYIYAGPHDSHVPKTFSPVLGMQALAELGFIVVQIDGMGTANRSRAFHDVCWKNLADAGFPDRILWIRALAKKYAYLDTDRVGIHGTSAGGQNALGALLFHPEFYKVAVASCGCHDNRLDKPTWNEQWMGLMGPHYEAQSNVTNAHKLVGKLLLIVGELDTNVPPESTMRVVDALIRASKEFDLLVVPGMGHSNGGQYGEMRRRDFFVRHLHGIEPPNRNAVRAAVR
jgi:dipeptidyl aminopeptidase/acylaminoacyl peptidase